MALTQDPRRALSVAEAAQASGLSPHALRYYERVGLLEPVSREGSGHRRYQAADLERIIFLTKLRGTGMPTCEGRCYAALMRAGETTIGERPAPLQEHWETVGAKLAGTVRNLELIDWKINFYRERVTRT